MKRHALILFCCAWVGCSGAGDRAASPPIPPPSEPTATPAVAAKDQKPKEEKPKGPEPTVEVGWPAFDRTMNDAERALMGTWIAEVDGLAPRTAFIDGMVGMGLPGFGTPQAKKGSILKVLSEGKKLDLDACAWLEFKDNFRGFRSECMIGPQGPSSLDGTNPLTGEKKALGSGFDWHIRDGVVHVRSDDELVATRVRDGKEETLRFRQLWYRLTAKKSKPSSNAKHYSVSVQIPAFEYDVPTAYDYEVFVGRYLGGGN